MSSGEPNEPQGDESAEESAPNAWTNTPPAPTFPPPAFPTPYPQDPSAQPPTEGQQPYGYGYPPQEFGAPQPPQFPGAAGPEYGAFPSYPQAQQQPPPPPPYEAPQNGHEAPPAVSYGSGAGSGDTERTQFVEQRRPAPDQTQVDGGYEAYSGQQGYQPQDQGGQYVPPPYFPAAADGP